jgi:hypothetical protein
MRIIKPPDVVFNVRVTLTGQYTYYPSKEVYLFDESIWFGRRVVNNVSDLVARRGYSIFLDRPVHGLSGKAKFATPPNF